VRVCAVTGLPWSRRLLPANAPTAWPSLEALGRARAEACKAALVQLGVPADQISTVGLGYLADPPGDTPAAAAQNRKIVFSFTAYHH
jgi:outer membrane protein OmpA-like peptidoglycan-associated protein